MGRVRDVLPLLGWLASLAAGIVLFVELGDGPLATPPLTDPGAWSAWAAERDAVVAGLAVARLLVLGLAWYLVGVTTVGLVARLLRLASLVRIADAMSGPVVRHVLRQAVGVSLAVGVVASSAGAGPRSAETGEASAGREVATAVALDDQDASVGDHPGTATVRAVSLDDAELGVGVGLGAAGATTAGGGDAATERMVGLPPALQEVEVAEELDAADDAQDATERDVADQGGDLGEDRAAIDPASAAEHEVVAGEHLWSIAEARVLEVLGGDATEAQIVTYWQALIADNRERLADPDNPDLLFPGQQLRLPDVQRAVDA